MASSRFMIVSDLHLETPATRPTYDRYDIKPELGCKHLCLLGDIGLVSDSRLLGFLQRQLQRFEIVFYAFGNHEPYNTDYATAKQILGSFAAEVEQRHSEGHGSRFVLLDQTRFDVSADTTVLGCTMFSSIRAEQKDTVGMFVTDFERINNWTPDDHNKVHVSDLAWLNKQVDHISQAEPHRTIIIFKHYNPTISAEANSSWNLQDTSEVLSAFATDLSSENCWTSPAVKLWAFGHTHFNCRYTDAKTGKLVVANQKGYARSEAEGYDENMVVQVDTQWGASVVSGNNPTERDVGDQMQDQRRTARSPSGAPSLLRRTGLHRLLPTLRNQRK